MSSIPNVLKTTALAALLGLGAAVTASAPASAETITTRCFGDDCYRVRCNDFGTNCVRVFYDSYYGYDRAYAPRRDQTICDEDGDNCHYVTVPGYYDRYGIWHDND